MSSWGRVGRQAGLLSRPRLGARQLGHGMQHVRIRRCKANSVTARPEQGQPRHTASHHTAHLRLHALEHVVGQPRIHPRLALELKLGDGCTEEGRGREHRMRQWR